MAWHPESPARRKRWAEIQAEWLRRQRDFAEIWTETPRPKSEADRDGMAASPSRPAPLAGPRLGVRRGKRE